LSVEELDSWLWALRTPIVSCYAIFERGGVTLVDANVAGQDEAILSALAERLGVAERAVPVRQILLTHAHADHFGSAGAIAAGTRAEVIGPAAEAAVFAGRQQLAQPDLRDWERQLYEQTMPRVPAAPPVTLDRVLEAGDALDWEVEAQLIAAPGHTPGQLAVWVPEHETLIAGDALATHEGRPIVGVFNIDSDEATRSATALLELEPRRLCVGHGETLTGDIAQQFQSPRSG